MIAIRENNSMNFYLRTLDRLKGSGRKTLGEAVGEYLRTVSVRKRKPEWESRRFDYFMAHFGAHSPLATTTRAEIGKWRDERLKTVVGATVQREANLLRNLFTVAVNEWQWIESHPLLCADWPALARSGASHRA